MIAFEWGSRELDMWRGGKVEFALARALRLAGNQALKAMQNASADYVVTKKLMARDKVLEGLPTTSPSTSTDIASMEWIERVSGQASPLAKFPNIQTKQGAYVHVNAAGSFKLLPNAFTLRLSSGHVGLFQRKGKGRLPVKELWTTRISDAMSDSGAVDQVQAKAMTRFESAFERGLERELAKLSRKG